MPAQEGESMAATDEENDDDDARQDPLKHDAVMDSNQIDLANDSEHQTVSRERKGSSNSSDDVDGSAEASSTSSDTGKSVGRGGYSADCSSSDQSSDDTGDAKPVKEGVVTTPLSKLAQLTLNEADDEDEEDDDEEEEDESEATSIHGLSGSKTKEDDVKLGEKEQEATSIHEANRRHRRRALKAAPQAGDMKSVAAVLPGLDHQKQQRHHARANPDVASESHEKSLHATSNNSSSSSSSQFHNSALYYRNGNPLLPWAGVTVTHPMDPRIDLSTVNTIRSTAFASLYQNAAAAAAGGDIDIPTAESYLHLMEAVRPFFHAQGFVLSQPTQTAAHSAKGDAANNKNSEGQTSSLSEGFTSFFTTTDSNGTKTGSPETSDMDKKQASVVVLGGAPLSAQVAEAVASGSKLVGQKQHNAANDDDESSMVVLARTKRKHRFAAPPQEGGGSENSSSSTTTTSCEKRVRIQEAQEKTKGDSVENDDESNGDGVLAPRRHHDENLDENDSKTTDDNAVPNVPPQLPPRIVTDVSSSNRTDSAVSNNGTSGSGSGSGANTASGSNRGSSGSGNDAKGSSEELAKGDNSGDGTNDGSEDNSGEKKKMGIGLGGGAAHRHFSATVPEPPMKKPEDDATRERKLQDKKRKRIEMRREYEAQQQFESSESSEVKDQYFRPGKPVTLDQVMIFSKIPRVVIQASPPFLVIHTNAQFSRLTGIDAHHVVGKPISALLSICNGEASQSLSDVQRDFAAELDPSAQHDVLTQQHTSPTNELEAAEASGRARAEANRPDMNEMTLERLIASSGFGHVHTVFVTTKQHKMVGRNVTVIKDDLPHAAEPAAQRRDEESNDTSLTSSLEVTQQPLPIRCRISIAPIVSSNKALGTGIVSDREPDIHQKSKRTKHHQSNEQEHSHRKYHPLQFVTHFVIQLQPYCEASAMNRSMESLSSNSASVEAHLFGLSKEQMKSQRNVVAASLSKQGEEPVEDTADRGIQADEEDSASSDPTEAIATIG